MNKVYNRVVKWNNARYPRVLDLKLTADLLREEYLEWRDAKTEVNQLDGLCDIIYVALGAIWKANVDDGYLYSSEIAAGNALQKYLHHEVIDPAYFIISHIDAIEYDMDTPLITSLQLIITAAITQMSGLGLNYSECLDALHIVCDSNASKSIKKTDPKVKANDGDKGPFFIPPEPKLSALLESAHARAN